MLFRAPSTLHSEYVVAVGRLQGLDHFSALAWIRNIFFRDTNISTMRSDIYIFERAAEVFDLVEHRAISVCKGGLTQIF